MRLPVRAVVLLVGALAVACGGNSSGPSSTAATIGGTVTSSSSPLPGVTVGVAGTSMATSTTLRGGFMLESVPAGMVTLTFQGAGVNARLPLGRVPAGDRMTVKVSVSGSSASLDDRNDDIDEDADEGDVEGTVSGLGGRCPDLTFMVGATRVRTSRDTRFDDVACTALANGTRVEVEGTVIDGVLNATKIEKDD